MSELESQPMAAPGEPDSYVQSPESVKKASIFGKLKDKTKKAGSRIKNKVGRKKNPDGTYAPIGDGEEHEEEEEITSDDSPSPASPASPATTAPRELGSTFQSEPSRYGSGKKEESEAVSDMSGLSLADAPAAKDQSEPPINEPKDDMYDGTGATAGDLGIVQAATSKEPLTKNVASEASTDPDVTAVTSEEIGDKDRVADKRSEGPDQQTTGTFSSDELHKSTDPTESMAEDGNVGATESRAMETDQEAADKPKDDTVEPKAEDLNNVTDGSESYTEKANDAAVDAKDTAADMNETQSWEEPSVVGTTKESLGVGKSADEPSAVKETVGSAVDTTTDHAAQARQTVVDAATPKQEDKALSEKVTEALGTLPAKASDTAASVTAAAKSPTTTTSDTPTHAPDAHSSDHPASPGILGKIGGLFGFGAKAPEEHPHDQATQ